MIRLNTVSTLFVTCCLASGAHAQQYTALAAPPRGELGHADILARALGGSFNTLGNRNLTNGSIIADRIQDRGPNNDQVWNAGRYNATVIAEQTSRTHSFGTLPDVSLESYSPLLNSEALGLTSTVELDEAFRWAIQSSEGDSMLVSRNMDNPGSADAVVTYRLLNAAGEAFGFALFFEDGADGDFNDVGILLTQPVLAPTPQAASIGLLGLGSLGLLAGRRRR